jgi:biopolymer transport protein ExbD
MKRLMKLIIMMTVIAVPLLCSIAQEASPIVPPPIPSGSANPAPPPVRHDSTPPTVMLTDTEKYEIRDAQIKLHEVQDQFQQLQRLQQDALSKLQAVILKVYDSRKFKQEDYALCDRPAPPNCLKAPDSNITLQPIIKTVVKTKPSNGITPASTPHPTTQK